MICKQCGGETGKNEFCPYCGCEVKPEVVVQRVFINDPEPYLPDPVQQAQIAKLETTSFVFSIIGFFTAWFVIGIVFSLLSLGVAVSVKHKAKQLRLQTNFFSTLAIIISLFTLAVFAAVIIIALVSGANQ